MTWLSSGRISSPALDAVLLDTGPLPAAPRNFKIMAACSVAASIEIQWRDATNTSNNGAQIVSIQALDFQQSVPFMREIDMLANERIRIVAIGLIVGVVSVSIDIPL